MKGMFVCFEGIDGSGKMTQSRLLKKRLEGEGRKCLLLSYPDYKSEYGKIIYRYLHGKKKADVHELFLLFILEKLDGSRRIRKALSKEMVVICDRYFYSTMAYQCAAGFDYEKARMMVDAADFPVPSVVLYMDIPTTLTYERKMKQKGYVDRLEDDTKYMEAVRLFYEKLMSEGYSGARWVRIDGTASIEKIAKTIARKINEK